jgi:hypothetical protein
METVIPAALGHTALFIERGKLYRNEVLGWFLDGELRPLTLFEGEEQCIAIQFPAGHIESVDGRKRWGSLDEFCKAHEVLPS